MQQVVRLGDVVDLVHLEIACRRCDRRGRMRVARLIAEHGAEIGLPDLAVKLGRRLPEGRGKRCVRPVLCVLPAADRGAARVTAAED